MQLLHSLLQRQVVRSYLPKYKQMNVDFVLEGIKCHKDDKHDVKGLDTQGEVPPFACSFNKSLLQGNMLAVADEEGGVCLYDARKQGPSAKLKGWMAHSNAIFDISWVCDEPKLVTASGDQTAQLWDVQQNTRLAVFKGHSCSLKSVNFQDENRFVFATGARDGNVMVWDMRCNKRDGYYKPVNTIHNCHSTLASSTPQRTKRRGRRLSNIVTPDSQQSVTSVKFQDVNMVISAGAVDGNIKVWDLRKNYSNICTAPVPYQVFPYPGSGMRKHGYSSLTLNSSKSKLFANCTNDVIYMYDCVTYQKHPMAMFRGHSNTTFYVKSSVSPDDQYLMSGSGDCDGYIWRVEDPDAPPFHLTGHSNEVTSVAWCPTDQTKVVTCSDDNSLKFWRVNYAEKNNGNFVGWCERKPNPPSLREEKDEPSKTPSASPVRSRSSSTVTSPVSLSPNPMKCSSPQQSLQNWLQSSLSNRNSPSSRSEPSSGSESPVNSSNKRLRETEDTMNKNKRICSEERVETKTDNLEQENTQYVVEKELSKLDVSAEQDKENLNFNMQGTKEHSSNVKSTVLSEVQSNTTNLKSTNQSECKNTETNQSEYKNTETNQPECKKQVKSNWLRDMGVKKKSGKVSRKVSSQPSSPLPQERSSPNTDLGAALKNTRSIRHYFTPVPCDENSPSIDIVKDSTPSLSCRN